MSATRKNGCELATIFREHGQQYRQQRLLTTPQYRAMRAIELCRTATLGGHIQECDKCGDKQQAYNSCRNRHCPKCQTVNKVKWVMAREKDVLPTGYFHVVFTLPHELNPLALCNPKWIYDTLFQSAWKAISKLGADPKRLGGQIGMLAILHTWGQNLSQHIHIHCLVPSGALSLDGKCWIKGKSNYLFPVKALSRLFRGRYVSELRQAYEAKQLKFEGNSAQLKIAISFEKFLAALMKQDWIVYAKEPFAGPEQVIKYIGNYTHRIAISNRRIIKVVDGEVTFKWRDYAYGNKEKIMTLKAEEFIRRFMVHVLPSGFMRIRHFGFLANTCRKNNIEHIYSACKIAQPINPGPPISTLELIQRITGIDITQCQKCCEGRLNIVRIVPRPHDTRQSIYWDTS